MGTCKEDGKHCDGRSKLCHIIGPPKFKNLWNKMCDDFIPPKGFILDWKLRKIVREKQRGGKENE
jgi:hypothetical protein